MLALILVNKSYEQLSCSGSQHTLPTPYPNAVHTLTEPLIPIQGEFT